MDRSRLVQILAKEVPPELAEDLVDGFLKVRRDALAGTLERAVAGKFVETFVQILQELEENRHDGKPNVDGYLRGLDDRPASLDEGLRFSAARLGRAMYTLRNKRNIAHKGPIDPNEYDLRLLFAAAQWVMAELIRVTSGSSMEEAGRLIEQVQAPVGGLVEDFGDRRLVLADLQSPQEEILVLLHSHYPDSLKSKQLKSSMDRTPEGTVDWAVRELWKVKAVDGDGRSGYRLTQKGLRKAREVIKLHLKS